MLNPFKKNDSPYYNNNQQLRACNVNLPYSNEQIEEIRKCKADPIYFIEKYVKIVTVDGIKDFILYPFQKKFIHSFVNNRFTLGKVFRQGGKTQVTVGYLLWYTLFSDEPVRCAILANDRSQSEEILARYKFSYELLPFWMQQGVKSWNVRTVELENKSKIITGATTKSGIRGKSINLIILDEVAFIPQNIADAFFASIWPTISSGQDTKIIAISTPQGMNHFYEMWEDAINGRNNFVTVEAHWSEIRSQEWADDMLKLLNNDKVKFAQEILCSFIGSSYTLISPEALLKITPEKPILESDNLKVYKAPEKNRTYFMSCDPSEGKQQDYSCFTVFDITEYPITICAIYRSNEISPNLWPNIIRNIAKAYNNAHVLIENNNSPQVAYILSQELEYENVICKDFHDTEFGIKTTKTIKRIGCANFKDLVENGKLIINDYDLKKELSTFVKNKSGSYSAQEGCNDDICMTCVLASWYFTTEEFKNLTDISVRNTIREHNIDQMEQALVPFGFHLDGMEDTENTVNGGLSDDQIELLSAMYGRRVNRIPDEDRKRMSGLSDEQLEFFGQFTQSND